MKKISRYLIFFVFWGCFACSTEPELKEVDDLTADYVLPQGKSPADERIVKFYDDYNTYILYEYSDLDFYYEAPNVTYLYELPDPQYMDDMLDFLNEIWFKFYPPEFHKKYTPYKILVAKTLKQPVGTQIRGLYSFLGKKSSLYVGYCSDTLQKMSSGMKLLYKNTLQKQLWQNYLTNGTFDIPNEFYEVSDYSKVANIDKTSPDYARTRGFVQKSSSSWQNASSSWNWTYSEWCTSMYNMNPATDLENFICSMINRTSAQWATDLEYPLVKQKYDILRNHFINKYNLDLKAIGDATYE